MLAGFWSLEEHARLDLEGHLYAPNMIGVDYVHLLIKKVSSGEIGVFLGFCLAFYALTVLDSITLSRIIMYRQLSHKPSSPVGSLSPHFSHFAFEDLKNFNSTLAPYK
jgi:hypothetical protein